jgi:hypothetical protein
MEGQDQEGAAKQNCDGLGGFYTAMLVGTSIAHFRSADLF